MQDGETLGLERTQSATWEEEYVETSRTGRDDVATSKPQRSSVIKSARTTNGKLSFCKNWNLECKNKDYRKLRYCQEKNGKNKS